jgi:hypothetical protein
MLLFHNSETPPSVANWQSRPDVQVAKAVMMLESQRASGFQILRITDGTALDDQVMCRHTRRYPVQPWPILSSSGWRQSIRGPCSKLHTPCWIDIDSNACRAHKSQLHKHSRSRSSHCNMHARRQSTPWAWAPVRSQCTVVDYSTAVQITRSSPGQTRRRCSAAEPG